MIAHPCRSQGIGSRAVKEVQTIIEKNERVDTVETAVQVNNPNATRFWESLGYSRISGPTEQPDGTTARRHDDISSSETPSNTRRHSGVRRSDMTDRLLIANDDGIQMIHSCAPGKAEQSVRDWVDFFLCECDVDVFAFCTARPDKTHHETQVGERDFSTLPVAPSQSQLHYKQILDEFRDTGTDILHLATDQVRKRSKRVLASIRMSDVHHASGMYDFLTPQFMRDHPEWRIKQPDGSPDVAMDYAHAGVRAHRLSILTELAENYDIDGLELDFMRSCRYFQPEEGKANIEIMSDFVHQIRDTLDRVAADRGRSRPVLGVRTPPSLDECPGQGLDPETWIQASWIDYVAPSDFIWLDYGTRVEDFAAICEGTDCGVYPCLNPFASEWVDHRAINSYTPNPVNFNRRVFFSEEHIRGLMRNYHTWGADGIYAFNFCYETIDNPDWVKQSLAVTKESDSDRRYNHASYFHLPTWRRERSHSGGLQYHRTVRVTRTERERVSIRFRMADGMDGEQLEGRLRFCVYNLHDNEWVDLDLNGVSIRPYAILERRKTNIHVAANRRYPGMHIPPHIAYELDLAKCPVFRGDNEIGFTFSQAEPSVESDIMIEAVEIDVGWTGHPQQVGYLLPNPDPDRGYSTG